MNTLFGIVGVAMIYFGLILKDFRVGDEFGNATDAPVPRWLGRTVFLAVGAFFLVFAVSGHWSAGD